MSIEVILRDHVEHLGRRGEIVRVADGYARNYLLPRKLALRVTNEARRQIEREREKAEARDAEALGAAEAVRAAIEALEIAIPRRVGENETLFGSVTAPDLAEALAVREVEIDRRRIQLDEPIKALGDHQVPVKVHREVVATLRVKVVAAE